MLEVIKLFVRRMLMGKGKGILKIPPQKNVDDFANDLFKKFKQNGVSDEAVTNPNDVKAIWNQITNREAQIFNNNLKDALQKPVIPKKAGEVFDLKGKKIKNPQNIMGGEEIIETEAQILARLNKGNKESLSNMRYEKAVKAEEAKAAADEDYIMKVLDPEDFATGGRAGLYQGGHAEIQPDLSDIGHGSDALMARNTLLTPGSQATTSTGLNYLLGEDNDTTRVPYGDGFSVQPFISASKSNQGFEDGTNVDLQDLTYGGNVMYDKGPFSIGIEHLKGKDKFDFKYKEDTIVKDTSDRENTNLLLAIDIANTIKGKARLNKDGGQFEISMPFAEGGRIPYKHGDMVLPKPKPMDEYMLKQITSQAGINTLDPKTREMFIEMYKKKIREKNKKADGGRIGFQGGGRDAGKDSDFGSEDFGGDKDDNREQYGAVGQYSTPKTTYTPPRGGGASYVVPTTYTPPVTTGGQSPFAYTKPEPKSYNYGITSNYMNPTFRKATIDRIKQYQSANQPKGQLETWQSMFGGDVQNVGYIPEEFKPSGKFSTTVGKSGYEKAIEEGVGAKEFGDWLKDKGDMFKEYHPDYAKTLSKQLTLSDNVKALGENYVRGFDIKGLGDSYDDQRKAVDTLLGDLKTKKEALKGTDKEMYLDSKDEFMKSLGVSEFASDYSENKDRLNDLGITSLDEYKEFLNKSIGLADGGPARQNFGMGRRAFLKLFGSSVAGIGAAKSGLFSLLKGGAGKKQVIKELTSVPINNIDGMPVWFKPLVNKVIKEGDDVTKKFATADREIVHTTKLPNSQTDVIVTQDLTTGNVSVDIGMGKHGFKDGLHGQPVRLEYKAAEDIMSGPSDEPFKVGVRDPHIKVKRRDEMTFDQKKHPDKAPEEFWVEEAEFTGGHPENVKFEDVSYEKFGQHGSNFDEVEKFAIGKVKKTKTTESKFLGKKYHYEGEDMAEGGRIGYGLGKKVVETVIKKAGEGKFTKNEVLLNMFKNTIKQSKSPDTKKRFTNFIEEIKLKPELSKDPQVWNFFTKGLPKNQKLVVYGDDTVDFWTQSEFGPHNIATSAKFQKKHPYLTKDQAIKIQNMEPEDQIFEMKRLEAIRKRTANATGGRIGFSTGRGIMAIIKNLFKPKPKKLDTVKDFIEKRKFMKTIVGNTEKNRKARELKMLKDAADEARRNPGFKFKDIDIDKEIRPIFDQSKDRKLHSSGGIAAMLGE